MFKKYLFLFLMFLSPFVFSQELPPNPAPGKCYVKCISKDEFKEVTETVEISPAYKILKVVPATYKTVDERVLSKEKGKTLKVIPATFKTVSETKLVKEATKKFVPVPATYKTVEERIMVKEASKKHVYVPATYKTVEEQILLKDAFKTLSVSNQAFETKKIPFISREKSTSLDVVPASFGKETRTFVTKEKSGKWEYTVMKDCPSVNKEDCMTACYVETPEVRKDIEFIKLMSDASTRTLDCSNSNGKKLCEEQSFYNKTILSKPASSNENNVAAKYTTLKKLVIDNPARYDEIEIPAEYSIVKRLVIDKPARVDEIEIPAEFKTVTYEVVDRPERIEETETPEEYITIKKVVLDQPAKTIEEVIPAKTTTFSKTVLVKKGGITSWEEVDCKLVGGSNILPILYEYSSAKLTPASVKIIDDNLLKLLNEKPGLRIEIMSHTDSRGNDDFNMSLSQQRAQSVVNYLVSRGISRNRLVARGYGETRLNNKCSNGVDCTEDQHQENRRTEFRILN